MTKEELSRKVDEIIEPGSPEERHIEEDLLHLEIIRLFCPKWVIEEIDRLDNADFPRWYA